MQFHTGFDRDLVLYEMSLGRLRKTRMRDRVGTGQLTQSCRHLK